MKTCICTIIKNEQQYLDEWIQYHLNLGIDHIFIFEDIDSNTHKEITNKYDQVTLYSVNYILTDTQQQEALELKKTKRYNIQHLYFRNILNYIKKEYEQIYNWCFVIDADEFITIKFKSDNLHDILSLYNNFDAIILKWRCYGANGLIDKPDYSKNGVIDIYTKEMPGSIPDNRTSFMKTCYNLKNYSPEFFFNQHHPTNKCNWVNTNFEKNLTDDAFNNLYIRHYITKSWQEYVQKIKERGFPWGKARTFDFFFSINSDLLYKKDELLKSIDPKTLVVLPYKESSSQGNEIKCALNLWKKFCTFNYHFVVIGEFSSNLKDEFPWVEFIPCHTKEKKNGQYNPHLDVQHKMEIILNMFHNYDGFIRMMDDNYAIKPFNLNDILTIHYHSSNFTGTKNNPTSYWNHDKWKTRQLLDKENLPHINYATHYPFYFEFSKLKEIWDKFDMRNESYCYEDIYFNYFKHEDPILDSEIRLGIWNENIFKNEFNNALKNPNIKFICNSVNGWSKELENRLFLLIDNSYINQTHSHMELNKENVLQFNIQNKNKMHCNYSDKPKTIQEKLGWLNIYDIPWSDKYNKPLKSICADKILVKEYVKEIIGKDICTKIIAIYNNADEIKWEELPNQFVIKTNHNSGGNIIVKNKSKLNKNDAINKLNNQLMQDFTFSAGFESHYHWIERKIFIEEYLETNNNIMPNYKFHCFNGEPKFMYILNDKFNNKSHFNYYDMNGLKLTISRIGHQCTNDMDPMPVNFELMKEYSRKLSNAFKYARIDFYEVNNKVYLGEITFTPAACGFSYTNPEYDIIIGNLLKI